MKPCGHCGESVRHKLGCPARTKKRGRPTTIKPYGVCREFLEWIREARIAVTHVE